MNGDFEADSVSSYALMTPAGWTSTGDVVVVSSGDMHSLWGGGSSPAGGNYVVLRMDGASISQQCFLTAGSTLSFYLRYRPGYESTGCTVTLTVTLDAISLISIEVPATASEWTLHTALVSAISSTTMTNGALLKISIAVFNKPDASVEIDNVVIVPLSTSSSASSVSATSLSHRYSFNDGTTSDSVASASALVDSWAGIIGHSAVISSGQLQLPGGPSNTTIGVGSFLQLPAGVFGRPAPAAVSIEMWITIASMQQSGTGSPAIFQLGSHVSGSAGSLTLTWESINYRGNLEYISADGSVAMSSYFYSNSVSTAIHVVVVLVNGGSYSSGIYVNGNIYNTFTLSGTMFFSSGSAGEINIIGAGTDPSQPALIGSVDEFRVWSGTLSQQDITAHYAMGPDLILGKRYSTH